MWRRSPKGATRKIPPPSSACCRAWSRRRRRRTLSEITLALADRIADATLARGVETGAQPLTVAVLDAGGHVVVMKRSDGSGILRCDIAYGKAWGALGMGFPTRTLAARAAKMPAFYSAIAAASQGRIIPVPGG